MPQCDDHPLTLECPACASAVPAATFCGVCGAALDRQTDPLTVLLRPEVYAAAHRQPVWLPRISSTLLPRLPGPARRPFRVGLILILGAIIVLAASRVNGPLGVVSTIGGPLLFLIYVWQSDVFRDLPRRILVTAMTLGVVLGVGWWWGTGKLVAGAYGVSTGSSLMLLMEQVLNVGLLISAGGAVLMLIPALVTRRFAVPARESLDGFVVGAFGALWFSTAATTTLLAPQFAEGLMEDQSAGRLFEDSITYGIVDPIVTTAAGGLVGLALWFTPSRLPGRDPRRARLMLLLTAVLAVAWYLSVWVVDAIDVDRLLDLGAKIVITLLALVTVRCGIQIALLQEEPDPWTKDPVLCVHCEHVVPDMPFCCSCGSAARAASRTSRRLRRESPPQRELAGET